MKKNIFLVMVICSCFICNEAFSQIIDVHNHLLFNNKTPQQERFLVTEAIKAALVDMDRYGIEKTIIMPPPYEERTHQRLHDVDTYEKYLKSHSNRFAYMGGGGLLNPLIHDAIKRGVVTPQLKREFETKAKLIIEKGAVGFGEFAIEHPCLGPKHNYQAAPADHELFLLLSDMAAKYDVPIDVHMEAVVKDMPTPSFHCDSNPKIIKENLTAFEKFVSHNRKAKIIWSHLGWDHTGERTVALTRRLLKKHPNLYMSFKLSLDDSDKENMPFNNDYTLKKDWLELIKEFPDRFLLGTDKFFRSARIKQVGPDNILYTHKFIKALSSDLVQQLGIKNPKKLFKL